MPKTDAPSIPAHYMASLNIADEVTCFILHGICIFPSLSLVNQTFMSLSSRLIHFADLHAYHEKALKLTRPTATVFVM